MARRLSCLRQGRRGNALTKGARKDVIEVFDAFRATKPPQPNSTARPPGGACSSCPNSVRRARSGAHGRNAADLAAAGNTSALLDRMAAMTQEQRDALLDNPSESIGVTEHDH